jgi:hypothetical protein
MTGYLLQHIQAATEIPMSTLSLITLMCSISMYFIRPHLVIPALSIIFMPFFVIFSVATYGVFVLLEVFPLNKYDQWLICTITSATVGVVIGLGFIIMISKLVDHFQGGNKRPHFE